MITKNQHTKSLLSLVSYPYFTKYKKICVKQKLMTETNQHTQCSNLFGLLIGEWDFLWHNFAQGKIAHEVKDEWLFIRLP